MEFSNSFQQLPASRIQIAIMIHRHLPMVTLETFDRKVSDNIHHRLPTVTSETVNKKLSEQIHTSPSNDDL